MVDGAVSARGHGRFWLGEVGGRDVVMIAHRFGWALEHGVAALGEAPILGRRCDNPLCQRRGVGHVLLSSHTANRQEWAARRHARQPLRDGRGSRGRSRAIRDILRREGTPRALVAVAVIALAAPVNTAALAGNEQGLLIERGLAGKNAQ